MLLKSLPLELLERGLKELLGIVNPLAEGLAHIFKLLGNLLLEVHVHKILHLSQGVLCLGTESL